MWEYLFLNHVSLCKLKAEIEVQLALSKLNDIYKISDVIGINYSEPEPCGGLLLSPGHDTLTLEI